MNKAETAKAIAIIQEVYPHFMDGRKPAATLEIWTKLFASETYQEVEKAIFAFISADTRGYPPNIGQIKEKMYDDKPYINWVG